MRRAALAYASPLDLLIALSGQGVRLLVVYDYETRRRKLTVLADPWRTIDAGIRWHLAAWGPQLIALIDERRMAAPRPAGAPRCPDSVVFARREGRWQPL